MTTTLKPAPSQRFVPSRAAERRQEGLCFSSAAVDSITIASGLLCDFLGAHHRGDVAVVSSFGAESAVLLAMAAEVDPAVPVLFIDTGQHFPETLAYRRELASRLGLTDVRDVVAPPAELAARDPLGALHAFDADACCALRKVETLDRALGPFSAWVSGRRRLQSATRSALPVLERVDGRDKLNPIAGCTNAEVEAEMVRRRLPRHPLVAAGYASIGCAPCTRPVSPGGDPRSGRWAGLAKTECGIHRPHAAIPGTGP